MRVTLGLCSLHIRITQVVLKNADAQPFAQTNCIRISSSLSWQLYLFTFKILFYVGVYLINNFVKVSGGQQRDSAIHNMAPFSTKLPSHRGLPLHIEQNSLCCTVGPCWLLIFKYSSVYTLISDSLTVSSPLATKSVSQFLFVNKFLCIISF